MINKKIALFLLAIAISQTAFSSILFMKKSVPNDAYIEIISLATGKTIKAVNVGTYAIISDTALNNQGNIFAIRMAQRTVVNYCVDKTKSQFILQLNNTTNTSIFVNYNKNTNELLCSHEVN